MNKVYAPCRPTASLKFTIDNILNLKTSGRSCDSCHPAGLRDDSATALPKDGFQSHNGEHAAQQRRDPGRGLDESGKRVSVMLFCHLCLLLRTTRFIMISQFSVAQHE